ncbi:MAG: ChuX/HutX family heme-like substrate-binding protein [Nitrosarchaeum sp.]|uniref:ChuX/HutX family heme-like substrate-binding protein n=1 Tax=Nitrosarchaeum sp. TaxID=2026886 RepID=UPI002DE9922E|nr:ChuX/HutX family heme-like substrate-binding protein [Nitrosarchaeum sp.]
MLFNVLSDLVKIDNILLIIKNTGAVSEIRSNSLSIKQKEKWITIGDNDGPAHMHINTELIQNAEFIEEQKPERTSFSVQFFDKDRNRILGAFFTKMYDQSMNLDTERKKTYDNLRQKYGLNIKF